MSLRDNLRARVELPCKLMWGTDPNIELWGAAIEIGNESMLVLLGKEDRVLWPAVGRKVRLQVVWSAEEELGPRANRKYLVCQGTVVRQTEMPDGGIQLYCTFRKGRFVDGLSAGAPSTLGGPGSKWTM